MERAINAMSLDSPTDIELKAVRDAAFHLGTETHEPKLLAASEEHSVRHLSAPIIEADGRATVMLNLFGLPERLTIEQIRHCRDRLLAVTHYVSDTLGG
jgi:DNA-binding IclR family transcriptional regulator